MMLTVELGTVISSILMCIVMDKYLFLYTQNLHVINKYLKYINYIINL